MIGYMLVGEMEQRTINRFKKIHDFETYIIAVEVDFDKDVFIFSGWLYKLNTPVFNQIKRTQYGRGTAFKQDIVKLIGNNS